MKNVLLWETERAKQRGNMPRKHGKEVVDNDMNNMHIKMK